MTRTKIVCTIGPASRDEHMLVSLMKAGMRVARQNFSHGTPQEHAAMFRTMRTASKKAGLRLAVLADLQGPKIRVGILPEDGVSLKKGKEISFVFGKKPSRGALLSVDNRAFFTQTKTSDRIFIDDGSIELQITHIQKHMVTARVRAPGIVFSHKGINLPDSGLRASSLTAKDKEDVKTIARLGFDWVALSFVSDPKDIVLLRRLLQKERKGTIPKIMIKIERKEALERFPQLLEEADGIMVARGDLGIEIPSELVPLKQKAMIELARLAGKPIVVATHLLDSMTYRPRPTRAEVSDVANAVIDHTDAVMLSAESAVGDYPVEAVQILTKILKETEGSYYDNVTSPDRSGDKRAELSLALKELAQDHQIDGIISSNDVLSFAHTLLLTHPEIPLYLACSSEAEARQELLHWGVEPFFLKKGSEHTFGSRALGTLRRKRLVKKNQKLAVVLSTRTQYEVQIIRV